MTGFPNAFAWRAACAADAVLATWAGPWAVCFAIKSGSDATVFDFVEAQVAADPGTAAFTLAAPKTTWSRFLEPVPPRHHHGIFAMIMRTLAMPKTAEPWSLTSLRDKLIKIGAKVVSHGRYVTFQMAEVAVPRQMFAEILSLIARLQAPPAPA